MKRTGQDLTRCDKDNLLSTVSCFISFIFSRSVLWYFIRREALPSINK